jgi:HSP20 family protein
MTKSRKLAKRGLDKQLGHLDDVFENFRKEVEGALKPWHTGFGIPSLFDGENRMPLCDMADKGKEYELHVEVPGIERDKINVKAKAHSLEIAAKQSENTEEKKKNFVYSERSQRSFYRSIQIPEEIVPSKIDARMNNGILVVRLPKKKPAKSDQPFTRVEVK